MRRAITGGQAERSRLGNAMGAWSGKAAKLGAVVGRVPGERPAQAFSPRLSVTR